MHDTLLLSAALGYVAAAIALYRSLLTQSGGLRMLALVLTVISLAAHAGAQAMHWFPAGTHEISFLNVLSLCALVAVALLAISAPFKLSLFDAGLVALPLAAMALAAEWALDAPGSLVEGASRMTAVHVVSSVMAFGLLSIAGVYALFVALIDHFLRRHHLNRLVRALPALDTMEILLFRLTAAGFIVLTLSLATGLLFISDLFAQHLAHKTVLSILAWLIFGLLLWGRFAWGWRGRTAVRLTIAGVVVLVLSYFGSKLVLEVILHRSWRL